MTNNKAKQSKANQYNITYKIKMPSLRRVKGDISIRVKQANQQRDTWHLIELLVQNHAFYSIPFCSIQI